MVGKTPRARAVPQLEQLEPREVPTTAGAATESFDGTAVGALPAGWSQWSTNGSPSFGVTAGPSQSAPLGLASSSGVSSAPSRTWLGASQPADVQVAASIYLSTLIPAQVFARGSNLGGGTPSYYALSVARGLHLQLLRVVNGHVTVLASIDSASYFSGQWVRATLSVSGGSLQVQLRRLDTNQYLNSSGRWQSDTTAALGATDTALSGPGLAGLARAASYTGTVVFDDFAVTPLGTAVSPSLARPTIPQHYSWIRLAELAYSGTPMDSTTDQLLRNSIDLVIPNGAYLGHIDSVAPNTPQLIYTNFSNLYQDLLTDWLAYADAHGMPREDAFYHVTAATPFSGNSASSQPVNWFWAVQRGGGSSWNNLTSRARGTASGGVTFGDPGQAVAVGYPERFREINVALTTPASGGWAAALEYPSAVDANGNPTAWRTLTPLSDGTAGLTRSGQLTFDPPPDWVPATINGSARLYYVRFRTTSSGGTVPTAATILGRDYVGAHGGTSGTIPAFDYAADTNHDGYLSDAEYAHRAPGKDARFAYEGRLFVPGYGQMRFATNPGTASYQAWAADYARRVLAGASLADGLFVDNSSGKSPLGGATVLESAGSYGADYGALLHAVSTAVGPKWLLANTSGGGTQADPVLQGAAGGFEEFALRPLSGNWQTFNDLAAVVAHRQALSSPSPYLVLDSLPHGGAPTDPRTQMATLAEYYLLADPSTTFLDFYGGYAPSTSWSQHYVAAVGYNVGQPVGGWSVAASGPDPTDSTLTYKILQRQYTNALVLYKPLSYGHNSNGTLADATATTYTLGGSYRVLQADGTLGPVVTSVRLRNGEGAILIPVGAAPAAAPAVAPAAGGATNAARVVLPPHAARHHGKAGSHAVHHAPVTHHHRVKHRRRGHH
jgi:hypothetical protein